MASSLDAVLKTPQLKSRTARAPSLTQENAVFHRLSCGLLRPPLEQLQDLVECALTLCNAGSAGISLLEDEGGSTLFRWVALTGRYRSLIGSTTPHDDSPCGVTLRMGRPQLFAEPGRYFACLEKADPPIIEGLVLPIDGTPKPAGTIWIVTHSQRNEFDMEDVRVMTSLAGFAAFASNQLLHTRTPHAVA